MIGSYFSLNGRLLPVAEAALPIDTIELTYGFGVYETLRLRHQKLSFVEDHINRLFHSAACIDLTHTYTALDIARWLTELVEVNALETATIKMLLLGGKTAEETKLFIFCLAPKFLEKKDYRDGVSVITFEHERFEPQAKTLNMLPSYIAYTHAQRQGAYEALFIDRNGMIREGTRSNFFALKDTTLYTPPKELVLDGITRRTVIACARQNNFDVKETEISLGNLTDNFDGAFLTNTSHKIVPIKNVATQSFKQIVEKISSLRKTYDIYMSDKEAG